MKPKRIYRTTPRTPEEVARDEEIRAEFAHRPSLEDLLATGEYSGPITQGELFTLREMARAIKQTRTRLGMSLADLAHKSGIDQAALSRLENGHVTNPTFHTLQRVAEALGLRLRLSLVEVEK